VGHAAQAFAPDGQLLLAQQRSGVQATVEQVLLAAARLA